MRTVTLSEDTIKDILESLLKRNPDQYREYESVVSSIISDVRNRGDEAVFDYTKRFDKWDISASNVRVTKEEIDEAYASFDKELIEVMTRSASNIRA